MNGLEFLIFALGVTIYVIGSKFGRNEDGR